MWLFVLIFVVDFTMAFAWGKCVKAVANNKALPAGLWAGFITLLGAIAVISYTHNNWLLIPAIIGSLIGTYLSIKYNKKDPIDHLESKVEKMKKDLIEFLEYKIEKALDEGKDDEEAEKDAIHFQAIIEILKKIKKYE